MSNTIDSNGLDRYIHLDINTLRTGESGPVSVTAKLDDDGVELSVWVGDECIGATWRTYSEMGVEVKALKEFDGDFR